jgi:hypothetical protein
MPSSGFQRHKAHVWSTDIQERKITTYFLKRKKKKKEGRKERRKEGSFVPSNEDRIFFLKEVGVHCVLQVGTHYVACAGLYLGHPLILVLGLYA